KMCGKKDTYPQAGRLLAGPGVGELDGAGVAADQVPHDGEPGPGAAVVSGPAAVGAREPLEDPVPVAGRDAGTVVDNGHHQVITLHRGAERHRGLRVAYGVVEQVR